MPTTIEDRVSRLEDRVNDMAVMSARVEERINALANACDSLRRVVWYFMIIFGLTMLGTIVYGAIGEKGFNTVKDAVPVISQTK